MCSGAGICRVVLALAVLILAPVRDAGACSCDGHGSPPCQNVFAADAVFVGTVSGIVPVYDDGPPPPAGEFRRPRAVRVDFTAVVTYRGVQASSMSVTTASDGPACGYSFTPGGRYLVYATRSGDGAELQTGMCSRTRPLAEAADDLRFFDTLTKAAPPGARVSGTIMHFERDLATGAGLELGPVPNVLVTAAGASSAFHATTDEQGRYELAVPPGKYQISASASAPLSARGQQREIDLRDARACFVADFGVSFDTRIKGSVRHASGEPASGVWVQLMASSDLGKTGNIQILSATSEAGGTFEFADVSPGSYVVGVGLTRDMQADLFPKTFHPGTADGMVATVVQIEGGEQPVLEPMTLPAARPTYRVTGTVVFEDGRPASGATVILVDGIGRSRQVAAAIKSDDGTFSFVVHEGLSYIARASYWDATQQAPFNGVGEPFVAGSQTPSLRIVLSTRR